MSTTVTEKGQVTIPKPFRDQFALTAGAKVDFVVNADGDLVLRRADGKKPKVDLSDLVGIAGPGLSTDEIMRMTRGEDWNTP